MLNRKNIRAEVSIVVLVLGVLLLCVLVFVNSFGSFNYREGKHGNIEEVVVMESCLSYIEKYTFYKNNPKITGYSKDQIRDLPTFKSLIISEGEKDFLICNSKSGSIKIKYLLN